MTESPVLPVPVLGPHFDDLAVGHVFAGAPATTLTDGLAAAHQAATGGRLRLALDHHLAGRVCGRPTVAPSLVWDVVIGQSTIVTQQVVANLFYRDLTLHRLPAVGDTLHTTVEVVALRGNRPRPGRRPTGLAVLNVRCRDHEDRPVLDFLRCAMLPARDPAVAADRRDDVDAVRVAAERRTEASTAVADWDLDAFRAAVPGRHFADLVEGESWRIDSGDTVTSAVESARLSLNIAAVHHDAAAGDSGCRLVYGGHTIALALAQVTRAYPNLVTVTGWYECQHLGPVHEGDTLRSVVAVERLEPLTAGGTVHLRSLVRAYGDAGNGRDVLDWRFSAIMA